jgi:hypothetical protein
MGDKWLSEYESFSIESLSKVAGVTVPLLGVINAAPKPQESDVFTREEVKAMSQEQVSANLAKVNKSMATWK